jgi:hypothetical protein
MVLIQVHGLSDRPTATGCCGDCVITVVLLLTMLHQHPQHRIRTAPAFRPLISSLSADLSTGRGSVNRNEPESDIKLTLWSANSPGNGRKEASQQFLDTVKTCCNRPREVQTRIVNVADGTGREY